MKKNNKGFRIAARTLRHLGAELITSEEIAINELLKNAFDAQSESAAIRFHIPYDMTGFNDAADKLEKKRLSVSDAALKLKGMFLDVVPVDERNQKLEIFKESKNTQEAAALLRSWIEKDTYLEIFDRGIGMNTPTLRTAFLVIGTPFKLEAKKSRSANAKRQLLGDKGIGRLSMMRLGRYAKVETTVKGEQNSRYVKFDWHDFDDPNKFLDQVEIKIYRGQTKQRQSSSGTRIRIWGLTTSWSLTRAKQFISEYLRRLRDPFATDNADFPISVVFNDEELPIPGPYEWFVECAHLRAEYNFDPSGSDKDSILLRRKIRWKGKKSDDQHTWTLAQFLKQLGGDEYFAERGITQDSLKDVGPFRAACYWYNRSDLRHPTGDWKPGQIKEELNLWGGGFAIYRDEFRVGWTGGTYDDWLEMDADMLRTGGYVVNRIQTVGSLAINTRANPKLVDSANREGLLTCPEFQVLRDIMRDLVIKDLRSEITTVGRVEAKKAIAEETTDDALSRAETTLDRTISALDSLSTHVPQAQRKEILVARTSLEEHKETLRVVRKGIKLAREQQVEILELAGIGMVVDIVIHELARITKSTGDLLNTIEVDKVGDDLEPIIATLRDQLKAVNKRIRAVDPLSPAGRHRPEDFDLTAFIQGVLAGYGPRFKRHQVTPILRVDGGAVKPVPVRMVRGLLAHVFENLITNSIYWIAYSIHNGDSKGEIEIDIDSRKKVVEFRDNGSGIDPADREEIFKPYFTRKPKGKGLGLYIARELSEYHGAKLYLDPSLEDDGRHRTFILELPKDE